MKRTKQKQFILFNAIEVWTICLCPVPLLDKDIASIVCINVSFGRAWQDRVV